MDLGPLIGDDDGNIGGSRSKPAEIELRHDLREFLEFASQRFVLAIPGGHAPTSFLRRAKIRRFVKLFR